MSIKKIKRKIKARVKEKRKIDKLESSRNGSFDNVVEKMDDLEQERVSNIDKYNRLMEQVNEVRRKLNV
jgi:predicted nuclease with TOPRIM domain